LCVLSGLVAGISDLNSGVTTMVRGDTMPTGVKMLSLLCHCDVQALLLFFSLTKSGTLVVSGFSVCPSLHRT
jgi:hypothetical protein